MNAALICTLAGSLPEALRRAIGGSGKIRPTKAILDYVDGDYRGNQGIADCSPTGTISLVNQNTGSSMYNLVIGTGLNAETAQDQSPSPSRRARGYNLQVTTQPGCGNFSRSKTTYRPTLNT